MSLRKVAEDGQVCQEEDTLEDPGLEPADEDSSL